MTDDVGIFQHAVGSRPDPAHGYCTDDVARALQVDLLHGSALGWPAVADSAWRSLRFLAAAFDPTTERFRNFRSVDRSWLAGTASEDSQGRAMLALGDVIATSPEPRMVAFAESLFDRALPAAQGLTALRAQASVVLGCAATVIGAPNSAAAVAIPGDGGSVRRPVRSDRWILPGRGRNRASPMRTRCHRAPSSSPARPWAPTR